MKKNEEEEAAPRPKSLRTFKIFCLVVSGIVIAALVFRISLLVKNSKFDGSSGFIVSYSQYDGKKTVMYAFDPLDETITQLTVISKTPFSDPEKILGIPADAIMKKSVIPDQKNFPLETTDYALYSPKEKTDMSLIDAVRLWWLSRSTNEKKVTKLTITLPQEEEALDTQTASLFLDSRLEREKQSIAIVNGTNISGLGRKLERMLSHIGVDVISITTAHQSVPHSQIIYYGGRTYTVDRLSRILPFPVVMKEGSNLSDIVIELGEDTQRVSAF